MLSLVKSTEKLSSAELAQLLAALPTVEGQLPYLAYAGMDPIATIRWLLSTGTHPSVLAEPKRHSLRLETEGGILFASWRRPKKKGMAGQMRVPLGPAADPELAWVTPFVASLYQDPHPREVWYRFIRAIGRIAGLEGDLGPRAMRHTFLDLVAKKTHDFDLVLRYGGVGVGAAAAYLRGATTERDLEFGKTRLIP